MSGPKSSESALRASYGLARATDIGIALVLVDVARAHGFESGLQTARTGSRYVRVVHSDGVLTLRISDHDRNNPKPYDIILPHEVERAIDRLEGHLSNLKKREGRRTDRLPSQFVGREDHAAEVPISAAA